MQISAVESVGYPAFQSLAGILASHNVQTNKALQKLSSGLRVLQAGDAPADLAMSERMRALLGREEAAASNIENAVSYMQTSDSYMQNVHDIVGRMQELAVSANDGTKSDTDRQALQSEFSQLQQGIVDITSGDTPLASFNGQALLQGGAVSVAIGPDSGQSLTMTPVDLSSNSGAVMGQDSEANNVSWSAVVDSDATNIGTQEGAAQAMEVMTMATDHVSQLRATRGSEQSRLMNTLSGLRESTVNTLTTESRIRDADMARELVNLVKFQTLGQIGRGVMGSVMGNLLGVG